MSSYDLTGEKLFLTKAQEIADRLLPAWNTPTGIPYNTINLASGRASNPGWTGVFFDSHPYVCNFLLCFCACVESHVLLVIHSRTHNYAA